MDKVVLEVYYGRLPLQDESDCGMGKLAHALIQRKKHESQDRHGEAIVHLVQDKYIAGVLGAGSYA